MNHKIKILADASLQDLEKAFPLHFVINRYESDEALAAQIGETDLLICRSTVKITAGLIKNTKLQCIATASSGTDHIEIDTLKRHKIHLIDAKGSNAIAVANYVMATIAYLKKEKYRAQRVGIIGLGAVGQAVKQALMSVAIQTIDFDPFLSSYAKTPVEALTQADILCLHPNLHDDSPFPSRRMINQAFLAGLPKDRIIINSARGAIVDEQALLEKKILYCTDVYLNEPQINPKVVTAALIATPHIAGHSLEAKTRAIESIAIKIHLFLGLKPPFFESSRITGPIKNNQNWPEAVLDQYDPSLESALLKAASDKTAAFVALRKAHRRHEF